MCLFCLSGCKNSESDSPAFTVDEICDALYLVLTDYLPSPLEGNATIVIAAPGACENCLVVRLSDKLKAEGSKVEVFSSSGFSDSPRNSEGESQGETEVTTLGYSLEYGFHSDQMMNVDFVFSYSPIAAIYWRYELRYIDGSWMITGRKVTMVS